MSDLVEAVKSGDRRDSLVALRDKLAAAIDSCESGRDIAALSRRLMDVMTEIEKLPDRDKPATAFERLKSKAGNG